MRQCNWAGDGASTGNFALQGLQIVLCLLARLNMGETLLQYERTVATALLCHTSWHYAMPWQVFAEELGECLLSSLVTKKGQNKGTETIADVVDLYQLISLGKERQWGICAKCQIALVTSVRQQLTAYLNAERVYTPWVKWCLEPTATVRGGGKMQSPGLAKNAEKCGKNAENAAKNAIENAFLLEWCLPLETSMFRLVLHNCALKAWTV